MERSSWVVAIVLTAVVMAAAMPSGELFSLERWAAALANHDWLEYAKVPLYLLATLVAALVFGWLIAFLIRDPRNKAGWLRRAARLFAESVALMGLSPLQAALSTVAMVLAFYVPLILVLSPAAIAVMATILFLGGPLGADIALRVVDGGMQNGRAWLQAAIRAAGDQAPALAGRVIMLIMFAPLAVASQARDGGVLSEPELREVAVAPLEAIFVAVVAALVAFGLSVVATGSRPGAPHLKTSVSEPAPSRARGFGCWGFVALALLTPIALMPTVGDPTTLRLEIGPQPPGDGHIFGTDLLGRDVYDQLITAWRDIVFAGILVAAGLFVLGISWRMATRCKPGLVGLELCLHRMPPAASSRLSP